MTTNNNTKMLKLKELPVTVLQCGFTLNKGVKVAIAEARKHKVILPNVSAALSYLQQLVWGVPSFDNKDADKALAVMKQAISEHGKVIDHEYHVKYNLNKDGSPIWDVVQGKKACNDKVIELRELGYHPNVDHKATTPVYNI